MGRADPAGARRHHRDTVSGPVWRSRGCYIGGLGEPGRGERCRSPTSPKAPDRGGAASPANPATSARSYASCAKRGFPLRKRSTACASSRARTTSRRTTGRSRPSRPFLRRRGRPAATSPRGSAATDVGAHFGVEWGGRSSREVGAVPVGRGLVRRRSPSPEVPLGVGSVWRGFRLAWVPFGVGSVRGGSPRVTRLKKTNLGARLILRAGMAELGQWRETQDLFLQRFAGSNPAPGIEPPSETFAEGWPAVLVGRRVATAV